MADDTLRTPTPDEALGALRGLPQGDLLLPYQQTANMLVGQHALLVIEKSRRVGLTWGLAAEAVLTAGSSRSANGTNVYYISYNTDMTKDFIDACAMWAKAFGVVCGAVQEELLEDGDDRKAIKALSISFASGFRIQALSSAPRSLRGKQGLIVIDEAAFVNALAELLKAAIAMLIWGGRVVVVSTHNGVDNPFNQLVQEVRSGERRGQVMTISFDDAIAQGLWERIKLVKPDTTLPKAEWIKLVRETYGENGAEELDVNPAQGAGSFIVPALIEAAVHPDAGQPALYQKGLTYLGRDIARRRDLDIIIAAEKVGPSLWLREMITHQNAKFSVARQAFRDCFKTYRVVRAMLDQTGMGEVEVELMQDEFGETRVQGVLFTSAEKLVLANGLKEQFENGTIFIPPNDSLMRALRSIKRQAGTGEMVKLVDDGTSDGHADEFWALALAVKAAALPYQQFDYQSETTRADRKGSERDFWGGRSGLAGMKGTF